MLLKSEGRRCDRAVLSKISIPKRQKKKENKQKEFFVMHIRCNIANLYAELSMWYQSRVFTPSQLSLRTGVDPVSVTGLLVVQRWESGGLELQVSKTMGLGVWKSLQGWIFFCSPAQFWNLSAEQKQVLYLQLLFEFRSCLKWDSCLGQNPQTREPLTSTSPVSLECVHPFLPFLLGSTVLLFHSPTSLNLWEARCKLICWMWSCKYDWK